MEWLPVWCTVVPWTISPEEHMLRWTDLQPVEIITEYQEHNNNEPDLQLKIMCDYHDSQKYEQYN